MRAVGVRRRAVLLTLALASLALGPVIYAAASPSGPAAALPSLTGTITKVDLAHHVLVVKVTKGAAKYQGKAVTLNLKTSPPGATSVTRLGHAGKLIGLRKNDRVVVTYKLNTAKKLVAVKVTDSGPAPRTNPTPTPTLSPSPTAPTSTETTSPAGSPTTSASPSPTGPVTEVHATTTGGHVFLPATVNITVGTTIKLVIDDGVHTLTSGTYPTASGAFSLTSGQTFTFNSVGDYPFFCQYHGGSPYFMTGTVHVTAG